MVEVTRDPMTGRMKFTDPDVQAAYDVGRREGLEDAERRKYALERAIERETDPGKVVAVAQEFLAFLIDQRDD